MNGRCQICRNDKDNRIHIAREMMFGLRDSFRYLECSMCGCLQLMDVPADWSRYYPPNYASLRVAGGLKTFLRHQWAAHAYGRCNLIGGAISLFLGPDQSVAAVRHARVQPQARILDIGCGTGYLLLNLNALGFPNTTGLDPHIASDLSYPSGSKVFKRSLAEFNGEYDVIMLHHSFEHMNKPASVMNHIARLLSADGVVIMRIPVADSYAWRHYGVHWSNLDAPRHLFLHTVKSMTRLASEAALAIKEIVYDSVATQFVVSEQYARDIPLFDRRSYASNPGWSFLTQYWRAFRKKADQLNQQQDGDAACFFLTKAR